VHYYRGEYKRVVKLATDNLAALPAERAAEYFGLGATPSVWDRSWLAVSLAQLGWFTEASQHEAEAIRLAESKGHAYTLGWAYLSSGTLHSLKGDSAKARSLIDHGIATLRNGGVVVLLADAVASSSRVLAQLGQAIEALNLIQEGEQLLERRAATGLVAHFGWSYHSLARACLTLGRLDDARRLGDRAVESSSRQPGFAAHALQLLGDIATHADRFDAETGEDHYLKALALWSSQDSVETRSARLVSRFELLGAQPAEMTVAPRSIVEGIDVVGHVGDRQLSVLVDLFLDPLFLQAAEE
jgi:tetratricopeptide (TPR) repeat protein